MSWTCRIRSIPGASLLMALAVALPGCSAAAPLAPGPQTAGVALTLQAPAAPCSRQVARLDRPSMLIGKVKLISDQGGALGGAAR